MMEEYYLALRIHPGRVTVDGEETLVVLPNGCVGVSFVFKDELSAREWCGIDTKVLKIETEK